MAQCVNTNSVEFQTLKNKSGIPEGVLETLCYSFLNTHQRFPELDELPFSNSEPHLREFINVRSDNSSNIQYILEQTASQSVEEANQKLNNNYRDLDVNLIPIVEDAFVEISHRPSINNLEQAEDVEIDKIINQGIFFNQALANLGRKYGIKFQLMTTSEIEEQFADQINDAKTAKAFVFNNNVYINTDLATIDSPLHEMTHILLGGVRYSNPDLYFSLVNSVENLQNYNDLAKKYKDRTRQDINEEIFVREMALHLTVGHSELSQLTPELEYELAYGMTRLLDSILMGKDSVRSYGYNIYKMSLKELARIVKSEALNNNFSGTINLKGGQQHRILANLKSDLLKNNDLKEYCV